MMNQILAIFLSVLCLSVSGCTAAQNAEFKQGAKPSSAPVKQSQSSPVEHTSRKVSHLEEGRIEDAISDFSREIEMNPENVKAYVARGSAYFRSDQFDEAVADTNRAIALDAKYAAAYIFRGYYYQTMKAYEKAVADYRKALKLDPEIAVAERLLDEVVRETSDNESEAGKTEDNARVECRWVKSFPFKKTVACRTKKEWGRLQKNSRGAGSSTSILPPEEGVAHTAREVINMYYPF